MQYAMKKILLTSMLLGAITLSVVGCADNVTPNNTQTTAPAKVPMSLLFVLSAGSGKLVKVNDYYTLTLNNIDPHVLWFSDRPHRRAGFVGLPRFLTNWSKSATVDPLNAAMVHASMQSETVGQNQPVVMRFSRPAYSNGQLTFKVLDLKGGPKIQEGTFTEVKLFFDSVQVGWFDRRPVSEQDLVQGYFSQY